MNHSVLLYGITGGLTILYHYKKNIIVDMKYIRISKAVTNRNNQFMPEILYTDRLYVPISFIVISYHDFLMIILEACKLWYLQHSSQRK